MHPLHHETVGTLAELISTHRECRSHDDYYASNKICWSRCWPCRSIELAIDVWLSGFGRARPCLLMRRSCVRVSQYLTPQCTASWRLALRDCNREDADRAPSHNGCRERSGRRTGTPTRPWANHRASRRFCGGRCMTVGNTGSNYVG